MTSNMISWRKAQEEMKHNREMERLTAEQQAETARHNVAVEYETQRTNKANEGIKRQQNAINAVGTVFGTVLPEVWGKSRSQAALNWANAKVATETAKVKEAEARTEEQEANLKAAQVFKTNAETAYIRKQTLLIPYQIDKYAADTAHVNMQTWLIPFQAENYGADSSYKNARAINLGVDTTLKEQTYNLNKWTNPAKVVDTWTNTVYDVINLPARTVTNYGNAVQSVEGAINGHLKTEDALRNWRENRRILQLLQ